MSGSDVGWVERVSAIDSAVKAISSAILDFIRSAPEYKIRVVGKYYEIPCCDAIVLLYPLNDGYVRFELKVNKHIFLKSSIENLKAIREVYYKLQFIRFCPSNFPELREIHISEINKKLQNRPYLIYISKKHDASFYISKFKREPQKKVAILARGARNIEKAKQLAEFIESNGYVVLRESEENGEFIIVLERRSESEGNKNNFLSASSPRDIDISRKIYSGSQLRKALAGTYE